jgi:hypothetical protein
MRLDWFKRSLNFIKTIRDYAERLKFEFNLEIQSEHFGNCRSLSIEGCSCRYMRLAECLMEMHSHFSDSLRQDSRKTFAHMQVIIITHNNNSLISRLTLMCFLLPIKT